MKTSPNETASDLMRSVSDQSDMIQTAASRHGARAAETAKARADAVADRAKAVQMGLMAMGSPMAMAGAGRAYVKDAMQRGILFADALRQWSDMVIEHNANGAPPVLIYDSEKVMDGRDLPRPCNYFLLRILPPEGCEIDDTKRPYVIIDPRAGHGAGIGGFKRDSQVGVAFKAGHPVYFVAFRQMPEPGQTLARVTEAEAAFLREIERLHPDSPRPVVIGNCQGGWATAILAATNPDLTGPIVLNGAPMSYWGGKLGQDPMRYSGGLAGGVTPAMIAGDIAGGIFDGAELVSNFEMLNPARNFFGKYFDLYQDPDEGIDRFLGFEKWWGGFYLMTTEEITWIVENLFVGNRLARNQAQIEPGRHIDLKLIRAPIICFASHGDNITPPAQALNWILDTYADEQEIEIRGQRILYMVHEQVGHLGIFVSSSIANREHSQMAETLANIEALPPGLYEIMIEDVAGEGKEKSFRLAIARRRFDDILAETGSRRDEAAFAAVARSSETLAEAYDATLRPAVKAISSPELGDAMREMHQMRVSRRMFNSGMPGMRNVQMMADAVRDAREPVPVDNPFRQAELLFGQSVENALNAVRDMREAAIELSFLSLYLSPAAMLYGRSRDLARTKKDPKLLGQSPEVLMELQKMEHGGYAHGLIRMMILIARTRGDTRADRLARSLETLHHKPPMKDYTVHERTRMIHQQTVICTFAPDEALATLPKLLSAKSEQKRAMDALRYVVGSEDEMAPATRDLIAEFARVLQLEPEDTPAPETVASTAAE